ncbi:hypothetical protein L8R85_21850 [Vibrio splendidus]|uniref:Uncharacterized protein n=1 Tax=Vibrio splendidus TaxID=29497 RepID=A0AA43G1B1_VIBSP|nr:hypothetical protein [Vibrio splendidus]MDH5923677.1 hypothetical protein [Vibrio splendidus]
MQYAPQISLGIGIPKIDSDVDGISFKEGGLELAKWSFWFQDWYPARYYDLGPALGVVTIASSNLRSAIEGENEHFCLVGRFGVVNRSGFSTENEKAKYFLFESKLKPGQRDVSDTRNILPAVSDYMRGHIVGNRLPRGKMFRDIHIKY